MTATVELLWVLLNRGWLMEYRLIEGKCHYCYRSPSGLSGSDYMNTECDVFPSAVARWLVDHVPMRAME